VSEKERDAIRRIALLNALHYGGKAQFRPVLGKLLTEQPQLKTKIRELISIINQVVEEVNKLSSEEQKRIVQEKWPETLVRERMDVERSLPPLHNAEKYRQIVTRFAPNPDCVLHLGSARAIVLSHEYAKIHRGAFRLRFEDTDPRLKRSALPFYGSIREDLKAADILRSRTETSREWRSVRLCLCSPKVSQTCFGKETMPLPRNTSFRAVNSLEAHARWNI